MALFIIGGKVVWSIGLVMLVGQVLGAFGRPHGADPRAEADSADDRDRLAGDEPQLLYDNHGAEIQQWLSALVHG